MSEENKQSWSMMSGDQSLYEPVPKNMTELKTVTHSIDGFELSSPQDNSFNWRTFLSCNPDHDFVPVPVWSFSHAPLQTVWDRIESIPGVKVEYKLGKGKGDFADMGEAFWIGSIQQYFGYMVKVQVVGYPLNVGNKVPTKWLNYLTDCFRIGHSSNLENGSMIPPLGEIWKMQTDWKDSVITSLKKGVSIPQKFFDLMEADREGSIKVGARVEALDTNCISRMKVGQVEKNVGKRLYIRYWDAKEGDLSTKGGIWCHETSGLVQPPGWSKTVGHKISCPKDYNPKLLPEDLTKENPGVDIQVGMKLEAVDPMNPSRICAATVVKVLKFGYMMISFDRVDDDETAPESPPPVLQLECFLEFTYRYSEDPPVLEMEVSQVVDEWGLGNEWFCCHVTSPLIFNCGFCKEHEIDLIVPKKYEDTDESFHWEDYFLKTGAIPLEIIDVDPLDPDRVKEDFPKGNKLEAVDWIDPSMICPATVADVKGRLLKIRFDGWPEVFAQWMDARSPDMYPIGWCDAHKYQMTWPLDDSDFWERYRRSDSAVKLKGIGTLFRDADEYDFTCVAPVEEKEETIILEEESNPFVRETRSRKRKPDADPMPIQVKEFKEAGRKTEVSVSQATKEKVQRRKPQVKVSNQRKTEREVLQDDHNKVKEEAFTIGRKPKSISQAVLDKVKKEAESLGLKRKVLP